MFKSILMVYYVTESVAQQLKNYAKISKRHFKINYAIRIINN